MTIGLYVHVPFCLRKCHYCDFASYPYEVEAARIYRAALFREMEFYAGYLSPDEKQVATVYIGGGTPTCLNTGEIAAIIKTLQTYFHLSPTAEITVEANPGTVNMEKLIGLRHVGVNRLSIGIQSFQKPHLETLGRIHSFRDASDAVHMAREAGFDNIGADLIFGVPGQTPEEWRCSLEAVAALGVEHISAYGLQVEKGTPLERKIASGEISPCDEDTEADMFADTINILKDKGYIHYEISNFALPGRACRHNLGYWRNQPYLGLGPAAHSYLRGGRFENDTRIDRYATNINRGAYSILDSRKTPPVTEMAETVFLGLRLLRGIKLKHFSSRFGREIEDVYGKQISGLVREGLLEYSEEYLRLTHRGVFMGNRVFSSFV